MLRQDEKERPTPNTLIRSPFLEYDFPGVNVGIAAYEEGPTGCTTVHFTRKDHLCAVVDLRGGSHATIFTDFSSRGWTDGLDAICLAGGSLMGLESACGVSAALFSQRVNPIEWQNIPLVSGGVIYDYLPRRTTIYPDKQLGQAAFESAKHGILPIGQQGAGRAATVGKLFELSGSKNPLAIRESGGQGGAFLQIGQARILILTVVNAIGALVNRKGQVVRGFKKPNHATAHLSIDFIRRYLQTYVPTIEDAGVNTTLTVVVTNVRMAFLELQQFARTIHSSLARAIQPFNLREDGDTLWAVSTQEVAADQQVASGLGLLASELAWDAVLSCFEDTTVSI